jgi:Fur family ferric uptake transcriptional regulator
MKRRTTRQLAAVYDALAASHDHPTADTVFQRVRKRLPRVSLGTVYRNLEKLRDQGRLRVVRLDGGLAHYDAVIDAHDHFVCEGCGAVDDLPPRALIPDTAALRAAGYQVSWYTTALYGLCRGCADGAGPRRRTQARSGRRQASA